MYFLRLQTCIVWFLSLFSEGLMCMRQYFKLLCCAAYILNLIVSICMSCWPNLWCSGVFTAEFRSFRKNSAKPDISRKYISASRIVLKNPAEGSTAYYRANSISSRSSAFLMLQILSLIAIRDLCLLSGCCAQHFVEN